MNDKNFKMLNTLAVEPEKIGELLTTDGEAGAWMLYMYSSMGLTGQRIRAAAANFLPRGEALLLALRVVGLMAQEKNTSKKLRLHETALALLELNQTAMKLRA